MKLEFDVIKVRTKLRLPIGDRGLSVDTCDFAVISVLDDQSGKKGWGYGICMTEGYFKNAGWWIQPMMAEADIRRELREKLSNLWEGKGVESLMSFGDHLPLELTWMRRGAEMALRDLEAKIHDKTVYQMLGGKDPSPRVKAYGSLLDFPLSDEQAFEKLDYFLQNGFDRIKVKIGAPSLDRDIARLKLIRDRAGEKVHITADGNQAWNLEETVRAMRGIEKAGIFLDYIEDPMPLSLTQEYPELRKRSPFKVAAHDYIQRFEELEVLMKSGGVDFVRSSSSVPIHQQLSPLAVELGIGIIYGNSNMESSMHSAAALPGTAFMEYSHLDYNCLLKDPIQVQEGCLIVPEGKGFGLDPNEALLKEVHYPQVSEFKNQPCPWKE